VLKKRYGESYVKQSEYIEVTTEYSGPRIIIVGKLSRNIRTFFVMPFFEMRRAIYQCLTRVEV